MSMDLGLKALSDVTVEHTNKCPLCGKTRYFNSRDGLLKSNRSGKPCHSCSNSIKNGGKGAVFNEQGQRRCFQCDDFKDLSEFYNGTGLCKTCSDERGKQYYKSTYRFSRYGLTKEEFEQMIDSQDNTCPICRKTLDNEIHIDHCHTSKKVRGILCGKCNKGLGQFEDDITVLQNAIKYLEANG